MKIQEKYREAAKAIKKANAIIITAGAGIGVDSGLPDFRGNTGFWKAYPLIEKLGYSFAEMANPRWFKQDPTLAWAFYGHRFNMYRKTSPHKGFKRLLQMGNDRPLGYFVFTSNVDGQFQKAGFDKDRISEPHGSIHHHQCVDDCMHDIWEAPDKDVPIDKKAFKAIEPLPACKHCGGLARPNILMFGDWDWISARSSKQEVKLNAFLQKAKHRRNLVIIEAGAGGAIPTVRMFSERVSRNYNSPLIRINPRETHLGTSHKSSIGLAEGASSAIQNIFREYREL